MFLTFLLLFIWSTPLMAMVEGVEHLGPSEDLVVTSCGRVEILLPESSNGTFLYVICGGVLYQSRDGGRHFVRVSTRLPLAVDQEDPYRLYSSNYGILMISGDGGRNWYDLFTFKGNIYDIQAQGSQILVGLEGDAIYFSQDEGKNFLKVLNISNYYSNIWFSPFYDNRVYVYIEAEGLYRSDDGGLSWEKVGTGLPKDWYDGIKISAARNGNPVLVIGGGKGYISTDTGGSFRELGLSDYVNDAVIDSQGHIWLATSGGLYRSDDQGQTWSFIAPEAVYSVAVRGETIWLGRNGYLEISTDGGNTWQKYGVATGYSLKFLEKDSSGDLWATIDIDRKGIYKYSFKKKRWELFKEPARPYEDFKTFTVVGDYAYYETEYTHFSRCSLDFDNCSVIWKGSLYDYYFPDPKNHPLEIWVAGYLSSWDGGQGYGIYMSTDGGETWGFISGPTDGSVSEVAYDMERGTIYAVSSVNYEKHLFVSSDNGSTWRDTGIKDINDIQLFSGKAFVSTRNGLYIYYQDTGSFQKVSLAGVQEVYKVYPDPEDPSRFFARTDNGLYQSKDGGKTWTRFQYFINDLYTLYDLVKIGSRWYAATDGGVISFEDNTPPSAPALISPESGSETPAPVTLSWQASLDSENDTVRYTVFLARQGEESFHPVVGCIGITQTTCTIADLENGTTYYWYVEASDGKGGAVQSERWNFTVPVPPLCTPDGDVAPLGARDGKVNIGDALVTLRFALGLETPSEEDKCHADVAPLAADGTPQPDGKITIGDALVILRMALGLVS
ncbi:fibronectin type III domain-containing protein [Thermosulfurimonas dismutans]|uniref:Fibronectin type-III domain-containing protein n=1 Tax=Thermosulfurimonas dismutans TaxID=999894 RepID=A0A179D5C2_9BACT|nr:hypothetical protein [Thermosulfurimonas dismutans]OAQ20919.1 hypothetical protein TDIS_1046 [Thermosulfurimonas dismutans]